MKTMPLEFILTLLLISLVPNGASGQSVTNYDSISAADFKLQLDMAMHNPDRNIRDALEADAFRHQRVDLVSICCDSVTGYFGDHFRETPSSDFKNAVVLMILRKPWPFDNSVVRMGGMPEEYSLLDTFREYAPEVAEALTSEDVRIAMAAQNQFDSLASRQKFADMLEKQMSAKKLGGAPSIQLRPPLSQPLAVGPAFSGIATAQKSLIVNQFPIEKPVQVRPGENPSSVSWRLNGMAVVFFFAIVAIFRARLRK